MTLVRSGSDWTPSPALPELPPVGCSSSGRFQCDCIAVLGSDSTISFEQLGKDAEVPAALRK
jgi:hypothetical protein